MHNIYELILVLDAQYTQCLTYEYSVVCKARGHHDTNQTETNNNNKIHFYLICTFNIYITLFNRKSFEPNIWLLLATFNQYKQQTQYKYVLRSITKPQN